MTEKTKNPVESNRLHSGAAVASTILFFAALAALTLSLVLYPGVSLFSLQNPMFFPLWGLAGCTLATTLVADAVKAPNLEEASKVE
jgi:tellurite resistance protein TehA-like permease